MRRVLRPKKGERQRLFTGRTSNSLQSVFLLGVKSRLPGVRSLGGKKKLGDVESRKGENLRIREEESRTVSSLGPGSRPSVKKKIDSGYDRAVGSTKRIMKVTRMPN